MERCTRRIALIVEPVAVRAHVLVLVARSARVDFWVESCIVLSSPLVTIGPIIDGTDCDG